MGSTHKQPIMFVSLIGLGLLNTLIYTWRHSYGHVYSSHGHGHSPSPGKTIYLIVSCPARSSCIVICIYVVICLSTQITERRQGTAIRSWTVYPGMTCNIAPKTKPMNRYLKDRNTKIQHYLNSEIPNYRKRKICLGTFSRQQCYEVLLITIVK